MKRTEYKGSKMNVFYMLYTCSSLDDHTVSIIFYNIVDENGRSVCGGRGWRRVGVG